MSFVIQKYSCFQREQFVDSEIQKQKNNYQQ